MASKHFVLVHGTCHGAWCWYKLKPLLESAGHKVTAIDMAASGINRRNVDEVLTFDDYNAPLIDFMNSIPTGQKVVLVGHSFGGQNLAFTADQFPEKIHVAIFLTALMPGFSHRPSHVIENVIERTPTWLDTKFEPYGPPDENRISILFGPEFLAEKLYQLSSLEDRALALALMRPISLFVEDIANKSNFSRDHGYGTVPCVYIVCNEDKTITIDLQRWIIENMGGVKDVKVMDGVDHMPMLSGPRDLSVHLLDIALEYDEILV